MSRAMHFFGYSMTVILALMGCALASAQQAASSTPDQKAAESAASAKPQNILDFPFYQNMDGFRSTLMLNNNSTVPLAVSLVAYNGRGEAYELSTRSVPWNSPVYVDLESELSAAPKGFGMGNLQCRYSGPPDHLTGQVSIVNATGRVSFEATMAMGGITSRLASVVSVLTPHLDGFVALTNLGERELKVRTGSDSRSASDNGKDGGSLIRLGARATKVIAINDLSEAKPGRPALIAFQHDGKPGDLTAIGVIFDKSGFSSTLYFVDPGEAASNSLAGAHFHTGAAPQKLGFSHETRFRGVLTLANTSAFPSQAAVSVDYTVNDRANHIQVAAPVLTAGQALDVDLTERLRAFGVDDVQDAGVDITYSGAPGAIIAKLTSFDAASNLTFDTPIKDPQGGMYRSSGSHPWRLDGTFDTVVALKNVLPRAVNAMVVLRFRDGQYTLPRIALDPFQTVSINLREIIAAKKKDLDGNAPPNAKIGKVLWFQEEPDSLIGRAEIYDVQTGIAGSFSCFYPCSCSRPTFSPSASDTWLIPSSFTIPYLGTRPIATDQRRYDCNGINVGTFDITSSTIFSSGNSGILRFTSNTVQAVGVGSTTFQGQAPRDTEQPPNCPVQSQANPGGNGIVQVPGSLRVVSATSIGCSGNLNYGIQVDIKYQVLDQESSPQPIAASGMTPWEQGTYLSGGSFGPTQLGPATAADGTFHDSPVGYCQFFPYTGTGLAGQQQITIRWNGGAYVVRNNNWTETIPSGSAGYGHGTISNGIGNDVNVKR